MSIVTKEIPIVMCAFNRLNNIPRNIQELNRQTVVSRIHLYVYNNTNLSKIKLIERFKHTDPKFTVTVTGNDGDANHGGIGRFYVAKSIDAPYVLFFDDDNHIQSKTTIADMIKEWKPKTIRAYWCGIFKPKQGYWAKSIGHKSGTRVHYTGTGGMICDSSVFKIPHFFDIFDSRYYFIEDLWLSYYCSKILGWNLIQTGALIGITHNNNDQNRQIKGLQLLKNEFLTELRKKGWTV